MTRLAKVSIGAAVALGLAAAVGVAYTRGVFGARPDDLSPPTGVPEADWKALAEGNNAFALDLYKKLAEAKPGNLIVSPFSVTSALGMAYAGARGDTATEMANTLHFTLPPDRLHPALGGVTNWMQSDGRKQAYEMSIANALWTQKGLAVAPAFRDILTKSYGSASHEADFINDREAARLAINADVEAQTRQRVKGLLQPGDLKDITRVVLTNAVYFRGTWKDQFDKRQTRDGDFETSPGVKVTVPMMSRTKAKLRVAKNAEFLAAELPYNSGRFAMTFLLPTKRHGLQEVERNLTAATLAEGLKAMTMGEWEVVVPRFKFETRTELGEPLQDLGLRLAFTPLADFTAITPDTRLMIDKVVHLATVELDEEGTVAAAATAVTMTKSSYTEPQRVRLDQPFLFLIRDTVSGNIVFVGRYAGPK